MSTLDSSKKKAEKKVVVLLSGGLDSTVALAQICTEKSVACVLTFDYGQRAARQELKASQAIAAHYGLVHHVIELPWLGAILPQALTPTQVLQQQGIQEVLPTSEAALFHVNRVWVPNRNGLFLNIAACYAESLEAQTIVFGANAEEGADFPDNTDAFRQALNQSLAYSTLSQVQVQTPVGALNKQQIIELGLALKVPFHLLWSCYQAGEMQCGSCPSCIRVKQAQQQIEKARPQPVGIAFAEQA